MTGASGSLEIVIDVIEEAGGEVRSALEWAEAKAMAADGVTKSEIARRLGINRRTAAKLVEASEPLAIRGRRRGRCWIRWSRCCVA